jgi:hypothetical protein
MYDVGKWLIGAISLSGHSSSSLSRLPQSVQEAMTLHKEVPVGKRNPRLGPDPYSIFGKTPRRSRPFCPDTLSLNHLGYEPYRGRWKQTEQSSMTEDTDLYHQLVMRF